MTPNQDFSTGYRDFFGGAHDKCGVCGGYVLHEEGLDTLARCAGCRRLFKIEYYGDSTLYIEQTEM